MHKVVSPPTKRNLHLSLFGQFGVGSIFSQVVCGCLSCLAWVYGFCLSDAASFKSYIYCCSGTHDACSSIN